ncbi:MAG: hypothetical protein PHH13_05430 [Candidatus Peribacteraceae bacterium]|nr:hypothetical protein [Candidatus Peribacteraceae bacterium]
MSLSELPLSTAQREVDDQASKSAASTVAPVRPLAKKAEEVRTSLEGAIGEELISEQSKPTSGTGWWGCGG